ncbi:AbrB family transcriptional regulator [Heyndrickxia ginsengihumi]|uniref:AbrB family transcriptional regulator n=1 Tax=Heyndrickxia ginsengihumi TaxID=363870 RepID=A0A6M0P5Y9_9BACI|nr:AbrB family transcriptional regulator [Heyndrickxia ginsengihumi]MBE6182892.1 AbrB family transcriptional regulator [Bacillus sp. (in: firmicutes)]MCM3023910.1 AbrB family transcriptional regulator [Heyndrickxia ginsengihumi]NEY19883.1 AbrB family transcriptional regulator [Heyndrickxia ginsengihumi]
MGINFEHTAIRWIITLIYALIGGYLFSLVHLPIPWLLGSLAAVMIGSKVGKVQLYWPVELRNTGLVIVGYTIGLSFTKEAIIEIFYQLPFMLLITLLLLGMGAVFALIVSKATGVDYPTILTGSIPGGLSQMVTLAEEIKGIDLTVVTFIQVTRLLLIVFCIPLLVLSPLLNQGQVGEAVKQTAASWGPLFPNIFIFTIVCIIFAFLGKKVKLPTPFMLGPIIATTILCLSGLHGSSLPPILLDISQILVGTYIGLMMKPEKLQNKVKITFLAILTGLGLIATSFLLCFILVKLFGASVVTSFLSVAPGGMDQMGLLAHEVDADISVVSSYQMFRIFFILVAVPPFLKWLFKRKFIKTKANE